MAKIEHECSQGEQDPTIERVGHESVNSGGYRITDMIDGRYVSRLYLGYTRDEALKKFLSENY